MSLPSNDDMRKAVKHPLRKELIAVFVARWPLSPGEASRLLARPLPEVSYHVRVLVKLKLLELHRQEFGKGTVTSYYLPNREILDLPIIKSLLAEGPTESSWQTRLRNG